MNKRKLKARTSIELSIEESELINELNKKDKTITIISIFRKGLELYKNKLLKKKNDQEVITKETTIETVKENEK